MEICKEILLFSKKMNQEFAKTGKINFQDLTDFVLKLSQGEFVAFNLLIETTKDFKTLSISGEKNKINRAIDYLGFSPIGKVWKFDSEREKKINKETVTIFKDILDLSGKKIPRNQVEIIEKNTGIKEVVIIRIDIDNKTVADFTIFMGKDNNFKKFYEAELFASQISILIEKLNISRNHSEKEEKFNLIIESTGAGTWDWDLKTNKVDFSPEWKKMLEYSDDEIEDSFESWEKLWHPEDIPLIQKTMENYKNGKNPYYEVVHRLKTKSGSYKWILTKGILEKDENGNDLRWSGVNIDVTDVKETENKHKTLVDNSYDIIYRVDTKGNFEFVSDAWTKLLGHSSEEVVGKSFRPYVHPEDIGKVMGFFEEIKKENKRKEISDYRLRHADGSWHIFTTNAVPIKNITGETTGYAGTARDITDLKTALEETISQKEELERFFSINLDLLCITDLKGNFLRINKSWERILGYPIADLEKSNFLDYIHPDDLERTIGAIGELDKNNPVINFTNRYIAGDGKYKYIEWRSAPYNNLIYAAARDVTDNIMISKELEIEKELFRTTLLSVGDGVISTDSAGYIILLNKAAQELTGWSQEEAKNMPLSKVFSLIREDNREKINVETIKSLVVDGTEAYLDILLISKEGKEIPIEKNSSPIYGLDGKITGVVTVFRDVTEKKEKQKEVEYLSFHDHLTGLYNRRYMEDSLKRLDTERNLPLCIMIMDINGLKMTNDAFGHKRGDLLLKTSAEILEGVTRADDILCRIGGDEFMLILPQTDNEGAMIIKERINNKAKTVLLNSVVVSLAVGYEIKYKMNKDINDIQRQADANMYKDKFKNGRRMRFETINNILKDIDKKYSHEKTHREKVSEYCVEIAKELSFDRNSLEEIQLAASVHDVGKIKIPGEVLNKKGKLSSEEWEELKKHSVTGYNILKAVDEYAGIAEEVLHHHERYDGEGYPRGLKGEEIPLISRIINVADAYEAMTSERSYKEAKSKEEAINELKKHSGEQFDPEIVKVFIKLIEERGY